MGLFSKKQREVVDEEAYDEYLYVRIEMIKNADNKKKWEELEEQADKLERKARGKDEKRK